MPKDNNNSSAGMRLDKWLWCARFFKTRGLASGAIKSGKVIVNHERVKPSKSIQTGDLLSIKKGPFQYEITIKTLAKFRQSATNSVALYEENAQSKIARENMAIQLRSNSSNYPRFRGRPTKRERRDLIRFKTQG